MPQNRPKEYEAFTKVVDQLLTVSKADLDAQVKAHQARQTANPRKAGRQRKAVTDASSDPVADVPNVGLGD